MSRIDNKKITNTVVDVIFLVAACMTGAFSTTAVMIPNGLTCGGLTGIVRILQSFIEINFSVMYYALAIVIWIVVILTLGFKEAKKIIWSLTVMKRLIRILSSAGR